MTIVSMTGFAESNGSHEGLRWRWEAKSVNGRGLDLRLRMPPGSIPWNSRRACWRRSDSGGAISSSA